MPEKIRQSMRSLGLLFLLTIMSIISTVFILPIFLLLLFYRLLIWLIVIIFRRDLHSFVSGLTAFFVAESPGKSISNIMIGLVLQGEISSCKVRQLFEERVLNLQDTERNLVYKKLKFSWTHFMGYAFWKPDPQFLLRNHVRDYDHKGELQFRSKCDSEDLQRIWPKLAEAPWKINHSPWELLVVQNYHQTGNTEPHTLFIFRIDHVHCDFYSIFGVFRILSRSPLRAPKALRNDQVLSIYGRLRMFLTLPFEMAKIFQRIAKGRKVGGRTGANNMYCSISSNICVDTIKSIKNAHCVDFSTVVLSCVYGAVARAIKNSGREPPAILDVGYVVPLPNHPGGWHLHATMVIEELPCNAESSQDRLMGIQRIFTKDHTVAATALVYFMRLQALIPSKFLRSMCLYGYTFGPSFIMSSVPALPNKEYMDGLEIVDVFTSVSSATALGMFITSGGVNGQQRFNFLLDKCIFGDEASAVKIAAYFEEELETLQTVGGSPLTV